MAKFSLSYVYEIIDKYSTPMKRMVGNTEKLKGALNKTKGAMSTFKASLKKGIKQLVLSKLAFAAVAAAAYLFARNVLSAFLDFEGAMNRVSAVTRANTTDMKKMSDMAKKMGAETAFSSYEAANALTFLAQAGLSVDEAIDALPGTLQLAAAGNLDLASAADIATNVLASNNLEISDLARVNDVLSKASSDANSNVFEFAGALKTIGPTAANMGISLEMLTASLGMLANSGLKAEMSGTLLRNLFLQTAIGAKKNRNVYRQLGIDLDAFMDKSGKFKNFSGFIGELRRAQDEGKLTIPILNKLFGERGFRAAQVLIGSGEEALNEFNEALKNAGGTAEDMAERQLAGLTGATKLLTSVWNNFKIELLDETVLGQLVEGFVNFLSLIVKTITPTGRFSQAIGGLFRAVGRILSPIFKVINLFIEISHIMPVLAVVFEIFLFVLKGLAAALTIVGGLLEGVIALVSKLFSGDLSGMGDIVSKQISKTQADLKSIYSVNVANDGAKNTLNGKIDITAKNATVDNATIKSSARGNLGMNIAGAM